MPAGSCGAIARPFKSKPVLTATENCANHCTPSPRVGVGADQLHVADPLCAQPLHAFAPRRRRWGFRKAGEVLRRKGQALNLKLFK